ncbi:MAG: glyoxalase [Maricaulis sp.]|uniref:Glyoxalase n=1 Tax=Maricaulis virginensis TaxID=144022 RepID=A0A9W6IRA4_9PROT|nr:VOC family protein [Maricaulis virginensis]MAC40010.1 glyoxalase [Oceanicaulis sp.]MAZ90461.1 glyoxalase [Maricaulis sp.]GLK53900.1 glyoxalase [Maricaulis virginensis]|tara:strand:+ start:166 stop:582 length:417 start_codon:yes stop_codon:yes gene_type:complete
MDQRVSLITLGVADTARSRAFYEKLGWKAAFENEEVVFFQLNGIVLGLFRRDSFDLDMKRDNDGTGRIALAYNVRDRSEVDPALDRAVSAGGSLLKRAEEAPWGGYSGYFADPDGHAWEVAHNPAWTISAAGHVEMSA